MDGSVPLGNGLELGVESPQQVGDDGRVRLALAQPESSLLLGPPRRGPDGVGVSLGHLGVGIVDDAEELDGQALLHAVDGLMQLAHLVQRLDQQLDVVEAVGLWIPRCVLDHLLA